MFKRTSQVNSTKVINVSLGSVFQIGDSIEVTPQSRALAVQRQTQLFYATEGNFSAFPIFLKEQLIPNFQPDININRYNQKPMIKVNHIRVTSVAAAGVYHIGSTGNVIAETRIKHIRQLLENPNNN